MSAIVEALEAGKDALPVCLWQENPYGLVSLLDFMKAFDASELMSNVRQINIAASLVFKGRTSDYHPAAVKGLVKLMDACQKICTRLELPMSALQASQYRDAIGGTVGEQLNTDQAELIAAGISASIENELSLRSFFAISPERTKYYNNNPRPFGDAVAEAFPSVSFDALEAGRCFALGRFTACVFHLMRVMEVGLNVVALQFNVPSDHTNWHNIIEGIEKAIRNLPDGPDRPSDWKEQQEFYSQVASHFMVTKDAWRNYTAHARGKYIDEEAEIILMNVRSFMQKLATVLHE